MGPECQLTTASVPSRTISVHTSRQGTIPRSSTILWVHWRPWTCFYIFPHHTQQQSFCLTSYGSRTREGLDSGLLVLRFLRQHQTGRSLRRWRSPVGVWRWHLERTKLSMPSMPGGLVLIRIGLLPTLGRGTGEVASDGHGCRPCDQ